jgi:hypothetical protein
MTSHVPLITYVYTIELQASGGVSLAHKICREERPEAFTWAGLDTLSHAESTTRNLTRKKKWFNKSTILAYGIYVNE